MTEAEWRKCDDPRWLLERLPGFVSERKLRLFATATCRRIWSLILDESCRNAVELAEQFADGKIGKSRLSRAYREAAKSNRFWDEAEEAVPRGPVPSSVMIQFHATGAASMSAFDAESKYRRIGSLASESIDRFQAMEVAAHAANAWGYQIGNPREVPELKTEERRAHAVLLREIFGIPIRAMTVHPAWQTATVVSVAHAIYDDRAFDRLPILADALEDAGCTDAAILEHCRGPGPHVRGCWVVDLLLGKS